MPKLKDCQDFKDLQAQVDALNSGPDLDEQVLSTTEVSGVTTEITISNGNTIPINHPDTINFGVTSDLISDNNESEGIWNRAANMGVSPLAARADHKHPIVPIPNPGVPVLTMVGGTISSQLTLDTIATEETISFKIRSIVTGMSTGIGWVYINVPSIAGFRPPEIFSINNYQTGSVAIQNDDGTFGASPRGPLMDHAWSEWSSTQRMYYKYYRRDNVTTNYPTFLIKYTRI